MEQQIGCFFLSSTQLDRSLEKSSSLNKIVNSTNLKQFHKQFANSKPIQLKPSPNHKSKITNHQILTINQSKQKKYIYCSSNGICTSKIINNKNQHFSSKIILSKKISADRSNLQTRSLDMLKPTSKPKIPCHNSKNKKQILLRNPNILSPKLNTLAHTTKNKDNFRHDIKQFILNHQQFSTAYNSKQIHQDNQIINNEQTSNYQSLNNIVNNEQNNEYNFNNLISNKNKQLRVLPFINNIKTIQSIQDSQNAVLKNGQYSYEDCMSEVLVRFRRSQLIENNFYQKQTMNNFNYSKHKQSNYYLEEQKVIGSIKIPKYD